MKQLVLVTVVLLLGIAGLVRAQNAELHGTVSVTYQSKYVWRGKNLTLVPSVYHQVTMDKSLDPDKDEPWVDLSVRYRF